MSALMLVRQLARLFRHGGDVPGNVALGHPGLLSRRIAVRGTSCKKDGERYNSSQFWRPHGLIPFFLGPGRLVERRGLNPPRTMDFELSPNEESSFVVRIDQDRWLKAIFELDWPPSIFSFRG